MECNISSHSLRLTRPRWSWIGIGVLAYWALGLLANRIPNPMIPAAVLALNMIVPVIAGYFGGITVGLLVGGLGTLANFLYKIPFTGVNVYEALAILPHAVMGTFAGFVGSYKSRIGTALTITIGHGLNLTFFLIAGVLPLALMSSSTFWSGLLAEIMVDLILIALIMSAVQYFHEQRWKSTLTRLRKSGFLLSIGFQLLSVFLLASAYWHGVPLAAYLFMLPVLFAAVRLGTFEAWLTAAGLSLVLGYISVEKGLPAAMTEVALILTLNLAALAVGELAEDVWKQSLLAENRLLALEKNNQSLIEADQLRVEMIQNISHELRTPLGILKGYATLLETEDMAPLPLEQQSAIHAIQRTVEDLTHLVEQVMVLDELKQAQLSRHPTLLDALLRSRIEGLHPLADQHHCAFRLTIPTPIPSLLLDAEHLGMASEALLENAIKFSPRGGLIEVKAWTDEGRCRVSITDQGIGIEPEKQAKLFRSFYQIDGSTTRRFGGLGMGLAMVREVVKAHDGDVWVTSKPGEGSTFGFWLPLPTETTISM